jgi:hypothetical protein
MASHLVEPEKTLKENLKRRERGKIERKTAVY